MTIAPEALAPSLREQKKARTRIALHETAARLVALRGLSAVTVEDICAEAQVSPRTFFNYYPSKFAAVLGLPDLRVSDEARDAFVGSSTNVVHDLCELVASVFDGATRPDKAALHGLFERHPELQPEFHGWLTNLRRIFLELVEQRVAPAQAHTALALVMAAVGDATHREDAGTTGEHIWRSVQDMVGLATA